MSAPYARRGDAAKKWIVTFGGAGLLPALPGTFGSLAAAVVFYLLCLGFDTSVRYLVVPLIVIVAVAGLSLSAWAQEYFKRPDPRQFVLDEVVGQWISLLFLPLGAHTIAYIAVAFFLFRAFDVAKPFPVNRLEAVPGAWGILLDDVMAALYAGGAFWALLFLVRWVTG